MKIDLLDQINIPPGGILQRIAECGRRQGVRASLLEEYDGSRDVLERDLAVLDGELSVEGLVVVENAVEFPASLSDVV